MVNGRKITLSFLALTILMGSLTVAFGMAGYSLYLAHASGITTQDFYIPSSQDPWGTTFDSNGNVWLTIPGLITSNGGPVQRGMLGRGMWLVTITEWSGSRSFIRTRSGASIRSRKHLRRCLLLRRTANPMGL